MRSSSLLLFAISCPGSTLLAYLSFAEKPINLLPIETEILLQILTEVVVNIGAMVCTVKVCLTALIEFAPSRAILHGYHLSK